MRTTWFLPLVLYFGTALVDPGEGPGASPHCPPTPNRTQFFCFCIRFLPKSARVGHRYSHLPPSTGNPGSAPARQYINNVSNRYAIHVQNSCVFPHIKQVLCHTLLLFIYFFLFLKINNISLLKSILYARAV